MKKRKKYTGWAGFCDADENAPDLHYFVSNCYFTSNRGGHFHGVIYNNRKEARKSYEDVRQVEVREVKMNKPHVKHKGRK